MVDKQTKKQLRKMANSYRAILQIGKDGLSYNTMETLDAALEALELVKCKLFKTSPIDVREAAIECAANTHSEVIHVVGHTFVLYRRSKENKLGM